MAKGTTPAYLRPFYREVGLANWEDVNVLELLVRLGFAQSKAEGKRLVEQNLLWVDDGIEIGDIYSRLRKIKLEDSKFYLFESGDVLCVGRILDEAVCHRVVFTSMNPPANMV